MEVNGKEILAQADFGGLSFMLTEDETHYYVVLADLSDEKDKPLMHPIMKKQQSYEAILNAYIAETRDEVNELLDSLIKNIQEV